MIESNQWFPTDQTVSTDYPLIIHCACVDARRASRRRFTRVIRSSRTLTQLCTQSRCPISICQAGNHRVLTIGLRIGCSPLFRPSCVPFVPCRESISSLAARCCLTSNESSLARCCRSHAREIFDWKPLSSREKIVWQFTWSHFEASRKAYWFFLRRRFYIIQKNKETFLFENCTNLNRLWKQKEIFLHE